MSKIVSVNYRKRLPSMCINPLIFIYPFFQGNFQWTAFLKYFAMMAMVDTHQHPKPHALRMKVQMSISDIQIWALAALLPIITHSQAPGKSVRLLCTSVLCFPKIDTRVQVSSCCIFAPTWTDQSLSHLTLKTASFCGTLSVPFYSNRDCRCIQMNL